MILELLFIVVLSIMLLVTVDNRITKTLHNV